LNKTKLYSFICLLVLCSGMFFINRYQTHDWGDDFAMYLMQAEKTAKLKLQNPTFFVFNELNPIAAPSYCPPMFSIFLSVLYPFLSSDVSKYIIVMHLLLLVNIFLFWYYLKSKHSPYFAILMCLLWTYNPWILYFKNEVMSEFLFVAFLLLFFMSHSGKKNPVPSIFLGALLISTRSSGLVIIPALITESLLKKEWRNNLLLSAGILIGSGIINVLFTGKFIGTNYISHFKWDDIFITILSNFQFYFKHIYNWFIPYLETKSILILPTQLITVCFIIIGLFSVLRAKKHLFEILFSFFYLLLILIYPYQGSGFRFLVPMIPVMLLLISEAICFSVKYIVNSSVKNVFYYAIPFFFLFQYYPNIKYIINNKNEPDGPYTREASQAWEVIKTNTNHKDTVYFIYPKAQALFTNRYSKAFPETNEFVIRYFLDDSNTNNNFVLQLKNSGNYDKVWTNRRFTFYKRIGTE
jgi:hypothetical protein